MISILTVEIIGCKRHLEIFIDSVLQHSKQVTEFIIAVTDTKDVFEETWEKNKIKFTRFSSPVECLWYGHALGLHAALEKSTKDYILFSDPDTFWHTGIDEKYLELAETHNLDYVGVSHHNAVNQCFRFFPYIISSMAKKDALPDENFLKGKLKFRGPLLQRAQLLPDDPGDSADGKFLIPNPIPELCDTYPNKSGDAIFDIGCNMWLWNEEKKGRWLSFQTLDCHNYNMGYYRNNFNLKQRFKNQPLLYHLGSSARNDETEFQMLKNAYELSKEEL